VLDRLSPRPEPLVPIAVRFFVAALAPLVAVAVLLSKHLVPGFAAAIALALLVGAAPEVPLHAVALLVASLTLALAAHDERGIWETLTRGARSSGDAPRNASSPS
jgi:hypothetical protein